MALFPGTQLGQFEMVGHLGSGGMGEVYRARDTKLGREVAIKVLPEDFAEDTERLERFEREARLLASLNHPNIATIDDYIHDQTSGVHYLVMEVIEGDTSGDLIGRYVVPIEEALPMFAQIAEAFENTSGAMRHDCFTIYWLRGTADN